MEKLRAEDLQKVAKYANETAAGPDQWTPADLKTWPHIAFYWLSVMLNLVEEGAGWANSLLTARAVFMAKDPAKDKDPLAYRVLLMMPAVYRLWARTRLQHMGPWIST